MANQKRFDALNKDTQNLIRECVEEATKEINQEIIEEEATLEEKFTTENGCEIYELTEEDIADLKLQSCPWKRNTESSMEVRPVRHLARNKFQRKEMADEEIFERGRG
mgnify:CR=1 FL=1